MKKLFIAVLALVLAMPMFAQKPYDHSIGGTVGTMYGFSYKGFITDNLAIQADLGVNLLTTAGSTKFKGGGSVSWQNGDFYTFEANPNLLYQNSINSWSWGGLDWFVGGGLSLGLMHGIAVTGGRPDGKFGLNGAGGVEIFWNNIPLAISTDFRPGYGLGFGTKDVTTHFFDWKLVVSVRYIL